MTSTIASIALALALSAAGQEGPCCVHGRSIEPNGPGFGWGFPNGSPDGVGWHDNGLYLPLGANRTTDYYFRRYYTMPANQMFLPTYYNAYVVRGQRYIPYANCGGCHPMGGPPPAPGDTPMNPYQETLGGAPRTQIPPFTGRVEAPPVNSGGTGLTP